jgi:hypothetical protein
MSAIVAALYAEAVEVSNAAEAFETAREFDDTVLFVEKITAAQDLFVKHVVEAMEKKVLEAAASGAKYAMIHTFPGSDVFEGFSTLFMLLGGVDYEQKTRLEQYGFVPAIDTLSAACKPFTLRHTWDRTTNENCIVLYWE